MELREMIQNPIVTESILLAVFMIMGTHYLVRLHKLFLGTNGKECRIMGRYATGTLSMLVPFSFICWEFGWWKPLGTAWVIAIVAGIFTGLFYGFDTARDAECRAESATQRANHNAIDLTECGFTPPDPME